MKKLILSIVIASSTTWKQVNATGWFTYADGRVGYVVHGSTATKQEFMNCKEYKDAIKKSPVR